MPRTPFSSRASDMRTRFREAARSVEAAADGDNDALWLSVLNFTAGYLLGAEMYQAAAALRRAMITCGLPPADLLEALLEQDDVH